MDIDLKALNNQFAIAGHIAFEAGAGGLVNAVIDNAFARAAVVLAGGHVAAYAPHGQKDVLWVSPNAIHVLGKALRGGIPVCFPWFGPHPTDPQNLPLHGFVRTRMWHVAGTRALPDGATELRLEIHDTNETRVLWPHAFSLELIVTVGSRLRVEWVARNPGEQTYHYTGALHPYFTISDIHTLTVFGLEGVDYLDKTQGFTRHTQAGALKIDGQTDRVYLDTVSDVLLDDPGLARRIHIAKQGSHTTVVWNPDDLDASMADLGAGQHRYFVCAEAANAVNDTINVPPGGEGRLGMEIWTESRE